MNVLLRPFLVLDVERSRIPSIDRSLIIEQRIVADQEPAILAVLTQSALLIFELVRRFRAASRSSRSLSTSSGW